MASRRRDDAQMILLAGILVVLAYLVFSTQSALLSSVGQEAGREAAQPLFTDYQGLRSGIAQAMEAELTTSEGVVECPSSTTEWTGRVQTHLALLAQLEANRGLHFRGEVESVVEAAGEIQTNLSLYVTNGEGFVAEEAMFVTECT